MPIVSLLFENDIGMESYIAYVPVSLAHIMRFRSIYVVEITVHPFLSLSSILLDEYAIVYPFTNCRTFRVFQYIISILTISIC